MCKRIKEHYPEIKDYYHQYIENPEYLSLKITCECIQHYWIKHDQQVYVISIKEKK